MLAIITAVAIYLGDIVLSHYIQEEILVKRFWHKVFPPKTFKRELHKTILETIDEYESTNQYDRNGQKFPFYHSQILVTILSKHILFNDKHYATDTIKTELKNNVNIIVPTNKDIENFFTLFVSKVNNNSELKKLYIDENYKTRIYEISEKIDNVIDILKKAELTPQIVFDKMQNQVEFQLKTQKKSGKYIPDTFVEIDELKEHLRYFVAPIFFIHRVFDKIKKMNFDYLREKFALRKRNDNFNFNIDFVSKEDFIESHDKFSESLLRLHKYLNEKHEELESKRINATSTFTWKIKGKIDDLKWMQSKVCIIKGNAGQGKTNFLCDLGENVLLKRNIPSLFITGYEIDAGDIYNSILKRLFPADNYTFNDVLSRIDAYCEENRTCFILMIDGLNENRNPHKLSQSIELFIAELLQHKYVKIILTCRTEYFKNNFQNILNSDFKDSIIQVDSINERLEDNHKSCLYESYCSYFNLKIRHISEDVYEELVENFLLLRIFAEAYSGQTISSLKHIYKEELFQKYYSFKSDDINSRLKETQGQKIIGDFDIRNFFRSIIEYMIDNSIYENIPLDNILKKDNTIRDIYMRFLDENILLRRDVEEQNGILGNKEFVNFTFDEFRDFLITDYLLNILYQNSKEKFNFFIEENINKKSRISEGCMSFLFAMERKKGNNELSSFIKDQNWYNEVLPYYIFDIKDEYITSDDKLKIKDLFLSDQNVSEYITRSLAYQRWNENEFPNLNIQLLFEIFESLSDENFSENVYPIYPSNRYKYGRYQKDEIENLIDRLYELLEKEDFTTNPQRHNVFQYILYFLPISRNINYLYYSYVRKYNNQQQVEKILNCKSEKIKTYIHNLIDNYEICL